MPSDKLSFIWCLVSHKLSPLVSSPFRFKWRRRWWCGTNEIGKYLHSDNVLCDQIKKHLTVDSLSASISAFRSIIESRLLFAVAFSAVILKVTFIAIEWKYFSSCGNPMRLVLAQRRQVQNWKISNLNVTSCCKTSFYYVFFQSAVFKQNTAETTFVIWQRKIGLQMPLGKHLLTSFLFTFIARDGFQDHFGSLFFFVFL